MPQPIATATIAAQAFRAMEMAPFSSFGDDTPIAQDVATQYPVALRMCLEASDWSFASRIAWLPAMIQPLASLDADLPYTYALPGDCVRMLHPVDQWVRWRIDGMTIRADERPPLAVRYTALPQNEAQLPAWFQMAVAYRLAALLSSLWVGSDTKTQALENRAEIALKTAARNDARSASPTRYDGEDYGIRDWHDWAIR